MTGFGPGIGRRTMHSPTTIEANHRGRGRQGSARRQTGPPRRREEPGTECHPHPERAQNPARDVGPGPVPVRSPHFQPARRTARIIRPIVRSCSGVAQWIVLPLPLHETSMSKIQTSRPPVNQSNSPRLPSISPERIRDQRTDQCQAPGQRREAGEQLVGRPGHAASLNEESRPPGECGADEQGIGDRVIRRRGGAG